MNNRIIEVVVKPSGNANIDGILVDQNEIRDHLKNLKKLGFSRFETKPYCGLVSHIRVENMRKLITSLR